MANQVIRIFSIAVGLAPVGGEQPKRGWPNVFPFWIKIWALQAIKHRPLARRPLVYILGLTLSGNSFIWTKSESRILSDRLLLRWVGARACGMADLYSADSLF